MDGVLYVALYIPLHSDGKCHAVILSSAEPHTLYYQPSTNWLLTQSLQELGYTGS
jgi:hypothetical protein